jgi:hypothetical protein
MTPEREPIQDFIVLTFPPDLDPDEPEVREYLDRLAEYQTMAQYKGRKPRALVMDRTEWVVTGDWREVERIQPAHDCTVCRAANDQAMAYLKEHPDKRLALGNLRYWEVW